MRNLGRIAAGVLLAVLLAFSAASQVEFDENLDRWDALAQRAETTIDNGNATDAALEGLRERIAVYRGEFDEARGKNAARIDILREQIDALAAPGEGEDPLPEDPEIATKRESLNSLLANLEAPARQAQAAFVRAEGLIEQIDTILRDRQNRQLLEATPSPLNPAHWRAAFSDLRDGVQAMWDDNAAAHRSDGFASLRNAAPQVILFSALGLVLLLRGRQWSNQIVGRLRKLGARGFGIWRFVVSLLRILLPFGGVVLLIMAALATEMIGPNAGVLLLATTEISAIILGGRWIAERVFSRDDDEALILLPTEQRATVRTQITILALIMGLSEIITVILEAGTPEVASTVVLRFPLLLIAAVSLHRIGVILRGYKMSSENWDEEEEERSSTTSRIVRWLGSGSVVVAWVAPALMALGFLKAADGLFYHYVTSLALYGLVLTFQRFFTDIYGAVTGQGTAARESLTSMFIGLALMVLSLPLLALTWGARFTDLTELWAAFGRGFAIGESRISPMDFVTFALIFGIGHALTRLVQSSLRNNVLPKTKIEVGGQRAIVSGVGYVGIFLAALLAITGAGIDLSSLAIVAGALSVGIGFGLQNIVSNFVSGIILLIERPISEGDWIEVGGSMGYVRNISVRSTRIETFDRSDVIVPNADLISGRVTNYTRGNTVGRLIVPIGVAYGTDTKRVENILQEIAEAQPMVLASPSPSVLFLNFGADALEFEVRCVLRDVNWMMTVKNDINHEIAARFADAGIEIPFAQRDVWLRNPEVLRPDLPSAVSDSAPDGAKT